MPFDIEHRGGYLHLRLYGTVTAEDLVKLAGELRSLDDSMPVPPNRVADLTEADLGGVRFPDVLTLAKERRERTFDRPMRTALVARSQIQVGFARMFQTLDDNPAVELKIVGSEEEALAWLAEGGVAAPPLPGAGGA